MKLVDRWHKIDPAWKFALGAFVVARGAFTAWAFVIALIFPVTVQNIDLFGEPVVAVFDLNTSQRYAFSREVDGAVLTFRLGDAESVIDIQTESVWSLRAGRAIDGTYSGASLKPPTYSIEEIFPYHGVTPEQNRWLAVWQRFDVNWYLAIAMRGYGTIPGDTHFPPLYPALIRLVGTFIGNYFVAGLILSNGALILALALFYQMVRDLYPEIAARAIILLLLFPTAFFCFSAYTEPLFLVLAMLSLRAIQQRRWMGSGFWTCCAILIRLQGIALIVPLVYALWTASRDSRIVRLTALGLAGLGGGVYLLLRFVAGDSAIVPLAETTLHARLGFPWENYLYSLRTLVSGNFSLVDGLNLAITTFCILSLMIGWRQVPLIFNLYSAASIVVLMSRIVDTQPLNSMSRYAFTLFPMFILLAIWAENPWIRRAVVYVCFPVALYLSAQFFLWGWVA